MPYVGFTCIRYLAHSLSLGIWLLLLNYFSSQETDIFASFCGALNLVFHTDAYPRVSDEILILFLSFNILMEILADQFTNDCKSALAN